MRCTNCGAEIPEGQWICPNCFAKVQIVPDYNPLEDVLAREVKGSVEYATRPIDSQDVRRYRSWDLSEDDYATRVLNQGERGSSTRVLSQGEMNQIRSQYNRPSMSGRPVSQNPESGRTPYRENGYVRQNAGLRRENSYVRRDFGNLRREPGTARRDLGNARQAPGYYRDDGNVHQEPGYTYRDSRSARQAPGYTYRDSRSARQAPGYTYRDGEAMRRAAGTVRRDNGYEGGNAGTVRQNAGYVPQNEEGMRYRENGMHPAMNQRTTGNIRQDSGIRRNEAWDSRQNPEDGRRPHTRRKKRNSKKRMQKAVGVFFVVLAVCVVLGFVFYQNSYAGIVGKGSRALQSGEYTSAERYFNRALEKDVKKAGAYTGLSKVYIQQKNLEKAEEVFITVIESQPENADLYQAAIQFYVDTEQLEKISPLLDGCDSSVLSKVKDYVSETPIFSLDEGTYPEVQQISLESEGEIRYTEDGSTPTASSTLYKEPILVDEGKTVLKAININKKGIPSLVASRTYTVELPVADAPAVTPSTGQYHEPTQITIQVPEGYTAYYTTDGSTPSAASTLYAGPLDMPEGSMIFSAVLISESGKMTSVTKRNYVLQLQ